MPVNSTLLSVLSAYQRYTTSSLLISSPVVNISLLAKRWRLKQNGVVSQSMQDSENVVHLSLFCQRIDSDNFKNVLNDYLHQNCRNFSGSMITSGLPNGCP